LGFRRQKCYESGLDLTTLTFNVHSANPVAKEQIYGLLKNYLKHLKGMDEGLVEIEPPIGKFIVDNCDDGILLNDGMYYHYSTVCKLLRLYLTEKIKK